MARYDYLTLEQREQFLAQGYIVLHDCFSREFAAQWVERAWMRLGYDADDPATWTKSRIHMPSQEFVDVREFAPKVWGAVCELLGGEERVRQPYRFSDAMIVNLNDGADKPWQPPSASVPGWHKDGDFFRHFLDSPEQGLLTLVLWSDALPQGGSTFVAADSVAPVARFLARHPEGVLPNDYDFRGLITECHDFREATGQVGDVYLLHPYMLHASSQNALARPRFLTNPPASLKEPMNFNRADPNDFSLVEQAILNGLGVDRLDYKPTAPRERVTPERERIQAKMRAEEQARLVAAT